VQALLERLSGEHPQDYWAAGDLALVAALTGDGPAMKKGVSLFTAPSTPSFAYDAYLKTLTMLIAAGHPQERRLQTLQGNLSRAKARSLPHVDSGM